MAPGGKMFRYPQHFGENALRHGSHEWLPYSKDEVRLKSSNTNLPFPIRLPSSLLPLLRHISRILAFFLWTIGKSCGMIR